MPAHLQENLRLRNDAPETYQPKVKAINALEPRFVALDERARPHAGIPRAAGGRQNLDELLVPALPRSAKRPREPLASVIFDVPAHRRHGAARGRIAEMRTRGQDPRTATLAVYVNAPIGRGRRHCRQTRSIDYLPTRDAEWMGQIYILPGFDRRNHRP